ncbi:hypothetical protein Y032_0014g2405 [Ancylostoma ceylanicum]|nr:hypothetical protein Y032_0014g2405 [Ancylostoma ceylanicum]
MEAHGKRQCQTLGHGFIENIDSAVIYLHIDRTPHGETKLLNLIKDRDANPLTVADRRSTVSSEPLNLYGETRKMSVHGRRDRLHLKDATTAAGYSVARGGATSPTP